MATKVKSKTAATKQRAPARKPRAAAKPAAKSGKAKPRTRGGTAATRRNSTHTSLTNQQRRDAIGLGLLASAAFFGFVFYLGWQGGRLGGAIVDGLTALAGRGAYLVPVALAIAGTVAILRPTLPALAFRKPAFFMLATGLLLAFSAGTFGLGAATPAHHEIFNPVYYRGHGGLTGESAFWIVTKLFGIVGAHVAAIGLVLTGLVQLTGVTLVSMAGGARALLLRLREGRPNERAETAAGRSARISPMPAPRSEDLLPPEPPGVEPVVRATHVEAPALDDDPDAGAAGEPEVEVSLVVPDVEPDPVIAESDASDAEEGAELNVTESDGVAYRLPDSKLLERSKDRPKGEDHAAQEKVARQLTEALGHFGVESKLVGTVAGPHVTRFELRLAPGTKMNKVAQLKDDLAYALASTDIRILAPIPGKQAVGVEVPNALRRIVRLGDIFQPLPRDWSPVSVWLGKDIAGKAIGTDIAKMPHMLVAGTTGAGKSGCINTLLCSILLGATPNDVKLVLVDPKQVELNLYEGIPHLLTPVVTSPRMAANVLSNLIREMEQRYTLMSAYRCRNIVELNARRLKEGEAKLPYILCVIDELADLMMVAPGEVEDAIIRLAQKARAIGIHLLLATQRPSADIITGMIKANVPSRIAFAVSSQTDSRVILDQNGAESLLGQGDMLFSPIGSSRLQRIQGAYVTEEEIIELTDFWREQGEPEFQTELLEASEEESGDDRDGMDPDQDDLLPEAIQTVVQMGTASTSMLQRRLRVGYTRAGRLIDMMERRGVISGYEGSKARQVLVSEAEVPRILELLKGGGNEANQLAQATAERTLEQPALDHETEE
ncbi:MAG: DNA translocase FtsK 4TM domain-containing protein [Actinobacteria bacterium]|nr:DNA translocase FtsK 4TM domain-containing protein [Actinomycetota bacterium]